MKNKSLEKQKMFDKPPIFVLGCGRSGTTILRRILDTHSNIACPPESSFLVQLARVYEIERSLEGIKSMGFSKEDVLEQMQKFTKYFFEEYAKSKGKTRWAEKSASYLNHANTIDLMFRGRIVYVGIIRHGLDVAYSLCGFDEPWGSLKPYLDEGHKMPIAAINYWETQTKKLLDFKNKVGERLFLFRYEELTIQPKPILKSLFEFLEEPWEEDVLNYNKFEHDPGFEDPKINNYDRIQPNSGKYKNWPLDLQKEVYKEAQKLLEKLDYYL